MAVDLEVEQRELRDSSRSFLDRAASSSELHRMAFEPPSLDRTYWKTAAELGWTSLLVPEQAGGGSVTGRPFADLCALADESGRRVAPGPLLASNVVARAITRPGAGDHASAVEAILEGAAVATWAYAESNGSWDAAIGTRAVKTDDGFSITGTKQFVEAAPDADLFLVTAHDEQGVAQFLVRRDAPGVSVTRQTGLDPSRSYGMVQLNGAQIPAAARVGETAADDAVESQLCAAIAIQSAETVGLMSHVFDITIDWVSQRIAFGRPIGSYQALKHRLAEHRLWLEAAAGLVEGLAVALDSDDLEGSQLASVTKAHVGAAAVSLIQDAIQMHGGIGVTWEHDLHLYLRRATANHALYGTPAEHRERLCRLAGV
jgi:alkylation response protein AidB-like acyl-CoA dehydrogenase